MKTRRQVSRVRTPLRSRAERLLAPTPRQVAEMARHDVQKLVQELQVYQVELEMQNDELRRAQLELEQARQRYVELYDFAPAAYLTLGPNSEILEANLAAGHLLDLDRSRLIRQRFTHFLAPTSQDAFYLLCQRVFGSDTRQVAELELVSARFKRLVVQLEAVRDASSRGKHCRVSLLDITDRKHLEHQILEISDNEQARIGQDIHDGLCQQLVSLSFDANLMEGQLSAKRPPDLAVAHRIASSLDQATTCARELSRGLFPIRLETDGLPSALEELARTTSQRSGIRTRFQGDEQVTLASRNVATHLYRIAREAVNNAVKHARPRLITIRLHPKGDQLLLTVEDDGVGVAPPKAPDKLSGMGLHIMEYRSRTIGATLLVSPGTRGGTVVTCSLPWKQGDQPLA